MVDRDSTAVILEKRKERRARGVYVRAYTEAASGEDHFASDCV